MKGAALRRSGLFDAAWYVERYGDVARSGLDPVAHYLRIGAELGRDPGPCFSAARYRAAHPDVAQAGLPPLAHYLDTGRAEGRDTGTGPVRRDPGLARLAHLRALLETGGLEDGPWEAIAAMARDGSDPGPAAEAARVCALWALRMGDGTAALDWLDQMDRHATAPPALRLIATAMARQEGAALRLYDGAKADLDLHLAATRAQPDAPARLACLNRALATGGLAPMGLSAGDGPAFDRLTGPALPPEGTQDDAPLVSVLMAAHNAADTLPVALASVLEQSWRALELIVIDDASTDETPRIVTDMAARDARVRLIRQPRNGGAYAARNAGLAQARGAYVTLHDADDQAHPARLARQVSALRDRPWIAGTLCLQARLAPDLRLSRWTGTGAMAFEDLSSLILPRPLLTGPLGGWDRLRVSADSELLRRVRQLFGAGAVPLTGEAPMGFQRDGGANATADPATGMGWFYYGARQEYFEAQRHHHARAASLRYAPHGPRPFAAPQILHPGAGSELRLDRVYAGRLMLGGAGLETLLRWLDADRAAGRRVGLVPLVDMGLPVGTGPGLHPDLRARVDGAAVCVPVYGERVRCATFQLLPGTPPPARQRYLPEILVDGERVLGPE